MREGVYLYKMGESGVEELIPIVEQDRMNNTIQPFGPMADWSPDSTRVVFAAYALNEFHDLAIYDVTTGEIQILATTPDAQYSNLVWLPERDEVLYISSEGSTVSEGTWNLVNVNDGTSRNYNVSRIFGNVYWSPYGAFYASAESRKVQVWEYGESLPYNAEIDMLTADNVVQWSPDGKQVAFVEWRTNQIYVVDIDGSNLRRVTSDENHYFLPQ